VRALAALGGAVILSLAALTASGCGRKTAPGGRSEEVLLVPSAIDFGPVPLGSSVTQRFVVQNDEAESLNIPPAVVGPSAGDFSLPQGSGAVQEPGQTLLETVTFTPSKAGERFAMLDFAGTTAPLPAPAQFPLLGFGLEFKLCPTPAALEFGNVRAGGTPAVLLLQVTNCGNAQTEVDANPVEGPNASDYLVSGTTVRILKPGESMVVSVAFAPSALGNSMGQLPVLPASCDTCPGLSVAVSGFGE
jgi:hypothetical protein